MKRDRILRVALRKISHFDGPILCGYLTSSDVLALYGAGARIDPLDCERARADVRAGVARPNWVYFTATRELLAMRD